MLHQHQSLAASCYPAARSRHAAQSGRRHSAVNAAAGISAVLVRQLVGRPSSRESGTPPAATFVPVRMTGDPSAPVIEIVLADRERLDITAGASRSETAAASPSRKVDRLFTNMLRCLLSESDQRQLSSADVFWQKARAGPTRSVHAFCRLSEVIKAQLCGRSETHRPHQPDSWCRPIPR